MGCFDRLGADPNAELVRHYLIERTPTGHVRLKGCPNEPDFGETHCLSRISLASIQAFCRPSSSTDVECLDRRKSDRFSSITK